MKPAMSALLLGKRGAIALGSALLLASCGTAPSLEESTLPTPATKSAEVVSDPETPPSAPSTSQPTAAPAIPPQPDPNAPTPTPPIASSPTAQPIAYLQRGRFTRLQMGDLMCYTTLVDTSGQAHDVGADFEICNREAELLNQMVLLTYGVENIADCQSAEPCGRSRQETIITDAVLLGEAWEVWSNGVWTVTVGRLESWDGTNNTGNFTYRGCDDQGNCLVLDQGLGVCRAGLCTLSWQNGDYVYTLATEMTEGGQPGQTTLLVRQGEDEVLRVENMEVVASSQF